MAGVDCGGRASLQKWVSSQCWHTCVMFASVVASFPVRAHMENMRNVNGLVFEPSRVPSRVPGFLSVSFVSCQVSH